MSSRRQKRAIDQAIKKRLEKIELKKRSITKEVIKDGGENPFDEFLVHKSFGPITYSKTGLKLAPLRRLRAWKIQLYHRYDTFGIIVGNRSLVIKKWNMRSKNKPKDSIGPFRFTFKKLEPKPIFQ